MERLAGKQACALIARGYTVREEMLEEYPKVCMIVALEGKIILQNTAAEDSANIVWLASRNAANNPALPEWMKEDMLTYLRTPNKMGMAR